MGISIEKSWLDTILALSSKEKLELIDMINGSIGSGDLTSDEPAMATSSRRYGNAIPAAELSEAERLEVMRRLEGAWKDSTPDDLAEQIINSRSLSGREINLDD
ncbi:hypothetical protein [Neolewinella sp.]|uniref:hypothetical protein n=1 Tax=Neolewinella sp. TaxID=2993543 RepID=UPI003B52D3AC